MLGQLTPAHAGAAITAVVLSTPLQIGLLQIGLRALHPPAVATTLLIALGTFTFSARDALILILGIGVVAALGAVLRRVRPRPQAGQRPLA